MAAVDAWFIGDFLVGVSTITEIEAALSSCL
jgi:hypothetical protein